MIQTRTRDGNHRLDIELDYKKYLDYYDDSWYETATTGLPKEAALSQLLLDLFVDMRGAIHVSSAPVKMLLGIKGFYNGFVVDRSPAAVLFKSMNVILARVAMELGSGPGSNPVEERVKRLLLSIGQQHLQMDSSALDAVNVDMLWDHMRKDAMFNLSVWYAQRSSYVSMINAYEYFLTTGTMMVLGVDELRSGDKRAFAEALKKAWGGDLFMEIWGRQEVIEIMNVRHALSHAGGRVTKQTKNIGDRYHISDNTIHIVPDNIALLIKVIQGNVEKIIQHCISSGQLLTQAT